MRKARKVPFGVSWDGTPVETGQVHRCTPSTATSMVWVFLSMVTWTAALAAPAAAIRIAMPSGSLMKLLRE